MITVDVPFCFDVSSIVVDFVALALLFRLSGVIFHSAVLFVSDCIMTCGAGLLIFHGLVASWTGKAGIMLEWIKVLQLILSFQLSRLLHDPDLAPQLTQYIFSKKKILCCRI